MATTTRAPKGVVDLPARSDARLAPGTVVAVVLAFAVLVVLPTVVDAAPPPGLDLLWAVGGPLTFVLAPLGAGLAGAASLVTLWRRGDLDGTTRRMHLVALLGAAASAAFLGSSPGQAAITWWQD